MEKWAVLVVAAAVLTGCGGGGGGSSSGSNNSGGTGSSASSWLIPEGEVADGGPGRDGIPSLDNPIFDSVIGAPDAQNGLVIGYKNESTIKAVSHNLLDWHEILNDREAAVPLVVSYCPLTGSALLWRSNPNAGNSTFGVSGLLFNSNLILYDRETESHWAQMREQSVEGSRIGEFPDRLPVVETTLRTWLEMYPDSQYVTRQTGFTRDYGDYPYGDYKTSTRLLFSVRDLDPRLHMKTRVLGVSTGVGSERAYIIEEFPVDDEEPEVINDTLAGVPVVIAGHADKNLAVAFESTLADGTELTFTQAGPLPIVMEDDEGNMWDVFGEAVSGPRAGERLLLPERAHIAYWFAWGAFNPLSDIHGRE